MLRGVLARQASSKTGTVQWVRVLPAQGSVGEAIVVQYARVLLAGGSFTEAGETGEQ